MREDFYYDSKGCGQIHAIRWIPGEAPRAVVQIVHGIADHGARYDEFARYLNDRGILVVAEDHMGHGQSTGGVQGYFHGGWFTAVEDTLQLLRDTMAANPGIPYVIFGHSMGSFMTRTLLARYPETRLAAAVICGTGWQDRGLLKVVKPLCKTVCRLEGEQKPSQKLQAMAFGAYNRRVEHPQTEFDWISRDKAMVDAYVADPKCGFTATAGLMRDMMYGIDYIEDPKNLANMNKELPVFFVAGGDDPVGDYGKGVRKAAQAFKEHGVTQVDVKIYPLARHEILNEINRQGVYEDIFRWIEKTVL